MAVDDYASAVRDKAGGAALLATCTRLADLTDEDRWHMDPMGHGYDPAVPFAVLAGAGWTAEDVQTFECDWPTVNNGDFGGLLLRILADLVAYCGLDSTAARVWLRRLYVPRADRPTVTPSVYMLRCDERLMQSEGLPYGDPNATSYWPWMYQEIRSFMDATGGNGILAGYAVDAGLGLEEVRSGVEDGTLDWDSVRVLAALRAGAC